MAKYHNESTKKNYPSRKEFVLGDYVKLAENTKGTKSNIKKKTTTQSEDDLGSQDCDVGLKTSLSTNSNKTFGTVSEITNTYIPPNRRTPEYTVNKENKTKFESYTVNRNLYVPPQRRAYGKTPNGEHLAKRESKIEYGSKRSFVSNNPPGNREKPTYTSHTMTQGLTRYHPSGCKNLEYKGFKEKIWLQDLIEMQPTKMLLTIASRRQEIEKIFTMILSAELLDCIFKILIKLCRTDFNINNATCIAILSCSCQDYFLDQLSKHILYIVGSRKMGENVNTMLCDYILYIETVISLFPQKMSNTLQQLVTVNDMLIHFYEAYNVVHCDNIKEKFQCIKDHYMIQHEKQKLSKNKTLKEKPRNTESVLSGKDDQVIEHTDFRKINIFPEIDDIFGKINYLIKPNIVNGTYDSVEHYLTIQFHLLREDFFSPLRDGISEYLASERKFTRVDNVRIFHNVTFVMPVICRNEIGYLINFDSNRRMSKMTWEDSKWFMYGSLLLFTSDNFNTVIFATVIQSDVGLLKEGLLIVSLKDIEIYDDLLNREFVLIESGVYFEPYLHVLKALKSLNKNNFPMEKYIVHVEKAISPPKYLCEKRSVTMKIDQHTFSVLDDSSWPSSEDLKLDDSQHKALKNALTRELVVIQGPPGTGKTFLGLKVAQILIDNSDLWNENNQPILVVCYTNHALDQFLSGLIPLTYRIVRIGGQSKNEELNKFNLKDKCKHQKINGTSVLLQTFYHTRFELIQAMQRMNNFLEKITQHKGIISYSSLKKYGIIKNDINYFETYNVEYSDKLFIEWLTYGMHDDNSKCMEHKKRNQCIPDEMKHLQDKGPSKKDSSIFWKMLFSNIEDNWRFSHYLQYHIPCDCKGIDDKNIIMCIYCRRRRCIARDIGYVEEHPYFYDKLLYAIYLKELLDCNESLRLAFDIDKHESKLRLMEDEIDQLQKKYNVPEKVRRLRMQADSLKSQIKHFKKQLQQEVLHDNEDVVIEVLKQGTILDLQVKERWTLYRHWIKCLKVKLLKELHRWKNDLQEINRLYDETQLINEMSTMKRSLVIGMTTTGAARLQNIIRNLHPAIVIVEEAAEVMESHILASLTKDCQHLILIGDHKQLRPSPAAYKLACDYNFDISLFERMINNGIPCDMLKLQHRMRPEISQLITPTIYPGLLNHDSVLKFEKIKGMLKSMFFFTHNYLEEEIEDSHSIRNIQEGDLVLGLCSYLVYQGLQPTKITILATYAGQMLYLQREQKKYSILKDVQITVVDNFQGEENDVILLSLVRSNKDAKIGFLKTENRVCVALSRARKGLYMFGNMDNLIKSGTIWPKIKEILENQEAIGSFLTLRCQVHASEFTTIRSLMDFSKVPNGCCTLVCGDELECGHKCKQACHIVDRKHENYKCTDPCNRSCVENHNCKKICWEDCGDCEVPVTKFFSTCGHTVSDKCWKTRNCMILVDTVLPLCGHKVKKPCYLKPEEFTCTEPCEGRLICGHGCVLNCHQLDDPDHLNYQCKKSCTMLNKNCKEDHKCEKMCFEKCDDCVILVQRTLSNCGHEIQIPCNEDLEKYNCKADCEKILSCGHPCPRRCYEKCGGCSVQVTVQLAGCQHTLEVKCYEKDIIDCSKPCERKLLCGHTCAAVCSEVCSKMCMELVVSLVTPICGHSVEIPCYLQSEVCPESQSILSRCQMPCGVILECKHKCTGTCAGCRQGCVHKSCEEQCEKILMCGHRCKMGCSEPCHCHPCTNRCLFGCEHMSCSRECGDPCVPCKEPCSLICPHKSCSKLCSEICDRQPCKEACDKLLPCLHPCIGFCGDPCPPFCWICNESDTTEVLGMKYNPDLRFIYLEDCRHIIEAQELEDWMDASGREIKLKECPKCKVPIIKTKRYRNDTKRTFQYINLVKNSVSHTLQLIETSQKDLIRELHSNYFKVFKLYEDFGEYEETYKMIERKQKSLFNLTDISTLNNQITVFVQLSECILSLQFHLIDEVSISSVITLVTKVLFSLRQVKYIGQQQLNDFNLELLRVQRLCELITTKGNVVKLMDKLVYEEKDPIKKVKLCMHFKSEIKKYYEGAYNIICSPQKFSKENDSEVYHSLMNMKLIDKKVDIITCVEMISTYCNNDNHQDVENEEDERSICTTVTTDIHTFIENVNSMLLEITNITENNEEISLEVSQLIQRTMEPVIARIGHALTKIEVIIYKLQNVKYITNVEHELKIDALTKHHNEIKKHLVQLEESSIALKTLAFNCDYKNNLYKLCDALNAAKEISQSAQETGEKDNVLQDKQEMKVIIVQSKDRHIPINAEILPNISEMGRSSSNTTKPNEEIQENTIGESMDMHKIETKCTAQELSKIIHSAIEEIKPKEKDIKCTIDKLNELINSDIPVIATDYKLLHKYLNEIMQFIYRRSSVSTDWEKFLQEVLLRRQCLCLHVTERKQHLNCELADINETLEFISSLFKWLETGFLEKHNPRKLVDHEISQIVLLLADINELKLEDNFQNVTVPNKQKLQKAVEDISTTRMNLIQDEKNENYCKKSVSNITCELQRLITNMMIINSIKQVEFVSIADLQKLTDIIIQKVSFNEMIEALCKSKPDITENFAKLRNCIKCFSQKLEQMPYSDLSAFVKPYQIKLKETLRLFDAKMGKANLEDTRRKMEVEVNDLGTLINKLALINKLPQNMYQAQDHNMSNMNQYFSLGHWNACPNGHVYIHQGNGTQEKGCCIMCGL